MFEGLKKTDFKRKKKTDYVFWFNQNICIFFPRLKLFLSCFIY